MSARPVIGIPADRRFIAPHVSHLVGEKYLTPLLRVAGALPLIIPALGDELALDELLDELDGLLFTGSPSNVEPHHYGGEASRPGTLHDPERDATTLALIPRAIAAGVPVLGICRGFQEMNVAFGGTLWQHIDEVPGHHVHHEDPNQPLEVQYGPVHDVTLEPGGVLAGIAGKQTRIRVNSLHHQGLRTLGDGLVAEAHADDGLIEAFRVADARRFALAVQWHPEWKTDQDAFSTALFQAFGAAARERATRDTDR
jgi:putative glutamine amidotransferase